MPSTRGERYARYTTEQKRAAVDHYLTHGRRASRTMRRLGYPSKEVLAAWIDELAPGERHVRRGPGPTGSNARVNPRNRDWAADALKAVFSMESRDKVYFVKSVFRV